MNLRFAVKNRDRLINIGYLIRGAPVQH
jgi:hypothetical protein